MGVRAQLTLREIESFSQKDPSAFYRPQTLNPDSRLARAQVRAGQLATAEGVSYLEAKHMLLLSYCTNIVFYLLLKAEGRPVRTHPVIGRLLQIRAYLVRRPVDPT